MASTNLIMEQHTWEPVYAKTAAMLQNPLILYC